MILECPSCDGELEVPDHFVSSDGSDMKCPRCRGRFRALPNGLTMVLSPPAAGRMTPLVALTAAQVNVASKPFFSPGDSLLGLYSVKKVLGWGRLLGDRVTTVYVARHEARNEDIAIKSVPAPGRSALAAEVLADEHRAQARIADRRHLLPADGALAFGDSVLVPMPLAAKSLRDWLLETREDLEARREPGLELVREACRGVAALHEAALVHENLKPENVLLFPHPETAADAPGPRWTVKVSDFGFSRGLDRLAGSSPQPGAPAADVHALGSILHELLSGAPPAEGDAEPPPILGPEHLAQAVRLSLDPDPARRPTAAGLEQLLSVNPEEEAAFERTRSADTETIWDMYLWVWGEGRHAAEAVARRDELKAAREARERAEAAERAAADARRAAEAERLRLAQERMRAEIERVRQQEEDARKASVSAPFERAAVRVLKPGDEWWPKRITPAQEQEAERLGVPLAIECLASGVALVLVPAGEFWMGAAPGDDQASSDEKPRRRVKVPAFYAGVAPVTQAQWQRVMGGSGPSRFRGPMRPVEQVSWEDCQEFLAKANAKREGPPLRLLTEAEWEYAARAGTETRYPWGSEWKSGVANGEDGGPGQTTEVKKYLPNAWGLLDTIGNVWEWCQDPWHPTFQGAPAEAVVWTGGDAGQAVARGGTWADAPWYMRISSRFKGGHRFSSDQVGLRCCRDASFP